MPGMRGFRCIEKILEADPLAHILIASGYTTDSSVTQAKKSGAPTFIGKPYKLTELLKRIRDILDENIVL